MGRKKAEIEDDDVGFFSELAEETGGEVFDSVGFTKYYIDTGNLALNYCASGKFIKGGFPGGRISEAFGPEASAKSLIGYSLMGSCQRMGGYTIYLDCECAGNPDFASQCGHLDAKKLITHNPPTFSEVESKIVDTVNYIRSKKGAEVPILIVWDSIAVTMTDREWGQVGFSAGKATKEQIKELGGNERPGEKAKAARGVLRRLNPFLGANNASLYIVNQLSANIGVMYGPSEVPVGGGRALPYFASCRTRFSAKKMKVKGKDTVVGVTLTVKNEKNRSFMPFWGTKGIQLYFASGVNPVGGLLSVFLNSGRIEPYKKGSYKVLEPWAGGKDYTFSSNKERNDVPLELLYDCPAIIDANDAEEVRAYLAPYMVAIQLTDNVVEEGCENDLETAMGRTSDDEDEE